MRTILLLMCSAVLLQAVHAKTNIFGLEIPGLHSPDGSGSYDRHIRRALVNAGFAQLLVVPPARAFKMFKHCDNCCISPANKNPEFYDFPAAWVETRPMDVAKVFVFSRPGERILNSIAGLRGKAVGTRFGMPYGKTFDQAQLNLLQISNLDEHLILMRRGLIDVFVAYVPDAYTMFQEHNLPPYPHDKNNPIAIHNDALVCRGVPAATILRFNQYLAKQPHKG